MIVERIRTDKQFRLAFILSLVAIHSFVVGCGLLFIPGEIMEVLGFRYVEERFFQSQGGAFHIIMSICYILPAINYNTNKNMVQFILFVKFFAAFFLHVYYFFVDSIDVVLFSACSDLVMAIVILFVYRSILKSHNSK
jgi:hypothetical protein